MSRRCKSCGGEYSTENTNGTPYYHVCPTYRVAVGFLDDDGTGKPRAEVRVPIVNRRDENLTRLADGSIAERAAGAGFDAI